MIRRSLQTAAAALMVLSLVGCYPASPVDPAQATRPPQAATVSAGASLEPAPPPESATRAWTAVAVTPDAPIRAEDRPMISGVPIPTPFDPALQQIVAQALEDLAGRLGVDKDRVEIVGVESVVWPDGGLGCPRPGMQYTQVQVDGLLIRFSVAGRSYEYHSGGARPPFLCE